MNKTIPYSLLIIGFFLIAGAFLMLSTISMVFGDAVTSPTVTENTFKYYTFFSTSTDQTVFSTTTTATSTAINAWFNSNGERDNGAFPIAGAKNVTFYFNRDGNLQANTGTTNYRIQFTPKVSPAETDWYYFNDWVSATSTDTYSTNIALKATSTSEVVMDLVGRGFYAVRCIVVETTDGAHSCAASAEY